MTSKTMNTKHALLVIALVLALTTVSVAQSEQSGGGLAGTWRVSVQLQTCDTHTPLGPAFSSYLAFNAGGTLTGTTSNPGFAPGQRSNDFGDWKYLGGQNYKATSEAYILFAAGPFVPGTQRISQAISLNGDSFTSWATVQFFDINHTQVRAACAYAQATRFQ